ncbi:N-acetyltransferase [Shimwellia pseudoproteus]|uniref:N-acetyltransferase n=1 Tax=Shimwellia pseudoproteus TaxID=570012 RepID=UPI0018EBE14D|nr:N-acetyltransferase [Shimwellia pseudoproteus]MBJ3814289.1 N-acetyltransferase [Shimwellia pseudoproteus]
MIRRFHPAEMESLLALWLESTTLAHPFIAPSYWQESLDMVRNIYLPHARTWVSAGPSALEGFISVLDQQFVGALFVAPGQTGKGIGRALMQHVQQRFPLLSLEVYQRNHRAVAFYRARGFHIEDCAWQEETRLPTWIMSWQGA